MVTFYFCFHYSVILRTCKSFVFLNSWTPIRNKYLTFHKPDLPFSRVKYLPFSRILSIPHFSLNGVLIFFHTANVLQFCGICTFCQGLQAQAAWLVLLVCLSFCYVSFFHSISFGLVLTYILRVCAYPCFLYWGSCT